MTLTRRVFYFFFIPFVLLILVAGITFFLYVSPHNNSLHRVPSPIPSISVAKPTPLPEQKENSVTIVAAGDIACGDENKLTSNGCQQGATAQLIEEQHPAAVLTLGDTQYEKGRLSDFRNHYDASWGKFMMITYPAVGNHEYETPQAGGYFTYFGSRAGDPDKGYYSFTVGSWHIIALNSNCARVGGCREGSAQERWLKEDLATHHDSCTLAFWHHPYFSSGEHGNNIQYAAFWKDLYAAKADIVLNGHDHDYERFTPQTPNEIPDRADGIREFVVGTGGKNHTAFYTVEPTSEVRNAKTFGILKLTLYPKHYTWQFIPVAGKTFTDSGTGGCHL